MFSYQLFIRCPVELYVRERERERESERKQEVMFASVWYAKKMGRRFINNVRRAKRHRQRMMV